MLSPRPSYGEALSQLLFAQIEAVDGAADDAAAVAVGGLEAAPIGAGVDDGAAYRPLSNKPAEIVTGSAGACVVTVGAALGIGAAARRRGEVGRIDAGEAHRLAAPAADVITVVDEGRGAGEGGRRKSGWHQPMPSA